MLGTGRIGTGKRILASPTTTSTYMQSADIP